ncbi:mCG1030685 [Mus musculus]|nr:mCG1030685 [Mus musculus]
MCLQNVSRVSQQVAESREERR